MFKTAYFFPYVMRRVFGFDDLLISIGNFMGLIIGASFLSIIEFVFFLFVPSRKNIEFEENDERKSVFVEFGESSTIHGLNHVANKKMLYLSR